MNWVPTFFFDASLLHIIWVIMLVFVKKNNPPTSEKMSLFPENAINFKYFSHIFRLQS